MTQPGQIHNEELFRQTENEILAEKAQESEKGGYEPQPNHADILREKVRISLSFQEWNSLCVILCFHLKEQYSQEEVDTGEHIQTMLEMIYQDRYSCKIFYTTFYQVLGESSDMAKQLSEDLMISAILEKGRN